MLKTDLRTKPFFIAPFVIAGKARNAKVTGNAVTCIQRLIALHAVPVEALADVLDALRECCDAALDIQLKVLQTLPALLSEYSRDITGTLLNSTLQIAFSLYKSKIPIISNTAAATLQQLVSATFDKLIDTASADDVGIVTNGRPATVPVPVADSLYLLTDICLLSARSPPEYIAGASLSQAFGLELLDWILKTHVEALQKCPDLLEVLEIRLFPLLIDTLTENTSFRAVVRAFQILSTLVRRYLQCFASAVETCLSLINHLSESASSPVWTRALCLELYATLFVDFSLVLHIYSAFDQVDGRRNLVLDLLGNLRRIAAEKLPDSTVSRSSASCIGLLEKAEAPNLPSSYLFTLVLDVLCTFQDGLARSAQAEDSKAIVGVLEASWPAILATADTYFNAALDIDLYRGLVRAFQKYAQAAGILCLLTPRDAFLTSLAKKAQQVPGEDPNRHLLCLRALINLGISLGSNLGSSWSIVLEPLVENKIPDMEPSADPEMAAVEAAAHKLYKSTRKLSDDAFVDLVKNLHCNEEMVGLRLLENIVRHNIIRLCQHNEEYPAWTVINLSLRKYLASELVQDAAADILRSMLCAMVDDIAVVDRVLSTLASYFSNTGTDTVLLDALETIIEHRGGCISRAWLDCFGMLRSAFNLSANPGTTDTHLSEVPAGGVTIDVKDASILTKSFHIVELISGEYLEGIPINGLKDLLQTVFYFSAQVSDLNIALTSLSIMSSISLHLNRPMPTTTEQSEYLESLVYLSLSARDQRPEVRDGALAILFNAIGSSSPLIFNQVLFPLLRSFNHSRSAPMIRSAERLIAETFKLAATLFSDDEIRARLLEIAQQFLHLQSLDISLQIFRGLGICLQDNARSSSEIWHLWLRNNPSKHTSTTQNNDIAMQEYLTYLNYLLRSEPRPSQLPEVLRQLMVSLLDADPPAYTSDTKTMSPLQSLAFDALKNLIVHNDIFTFLIEAMLLTVPTASKFGAWSRNCMHLLVQMTEPDVLQSLQALHQLIALKFTSRDVDTWQEATTSAILLIKKVAKPEPAFWNTFNKTVQLIVTPDCAQGNELFDMDALASIHSYLLPQLRTQDSGRQEYCRVIFGSSLIHPPHDHDMSDDGDMLKNLERPRDGQIRYLYPCQRQKMAHQTLDILFDLVRAQNTDLAMIAGPLVILRAGLTLKAYVSDQPLRGQMPQPPSQRDELILILHKLITLDSVPEAIPGVRQGLSAHKLHLIRLNPLILRAAAITYEDHGVSRALNQALEVISNEFLLPR